MQAEPYACVIIETLVLCGCHGKSSNRMQELDAHPFIHSCMRAFRRAMDRRAVHGRSCAGGGGSGSTTSNKLWDPEGSWR